MTSTDILGAPEAGEAALDLAPPASMRAPSRGVLRTLAETWSNGELIAVMTWREVRMRYRSSVLGLAWSMLNPLFLLLVYWLLFTVIFPYALVPNYPVYMLLGLIAWNFFAGSVAVGSVSLIINASIVTRVSFPRQIIPISQVLHHGVNFGIGFLLVIPFLAAGGLAPALPTLQVIPVLALFFAFVSGLSLAVAAATVFFRDVEHLIGVILFPLFFATPILWDFAAQGVTGGLEKLLFYGNPVTPFIVAFRTCFYDPKWLDASIWIYMVGAGAAALLAGAWLFSRLYDELATEL
jgi:ABC-2 type transport system permease protein